MNLNLADKIHVLHYLDTVPNYTVVTRVFRTTLFKIARTKKQKTQIIPETGNATPITIKRPLRARYPVIDSEVMSFVEFARSQRLSVT